MTITCICKRHRSSRLYTYTLSVCMQINYNPKQERDIISMHGEHAAVSLKNSMLYILTMYNQCEVVLWHSASHHADISSIIGIFCCTIFKYDVSRMNCSIELWISFHCNIWVTLGKVTVYCTRYASGQDVANIFGQFVHAWFQDDGCIYILKIKMTRSN